jgi:diguanylate cyclase (GGDEF)-like protein
MNKTNTIQTSKIVLLMAFLYYATGIISASFLSQDTIAIVSAFIPEGVALAGVLIFGVRVLPGIFIGQLLLAQFEWGNILVSLGVALTNTFEAYIAYKLFYKFNLQKDLKTFRDNVGLLIVILLVQLFAALINNLILVFTQTICVGDFFQNSFYWWFGNIMGQILFAPLLMLIYSNTQTINIYKFILLIITTIIYNVVIQIYLPIDNISLFLLLTLPFSIYISTKNILEGVLVSVSFAMCTTYITHLDMGLFTNESTTINNFIDLNYFILSHMILVLLIGTLFREKEEAIKELKSMAHFDYLTGLPNRHLLREEIHHAVLIAKDYNQKSAICYIDLDGFKKINDTLGHNIGDETLKNVVSRIRPHMFTRDVLLRIGGDEFLLILNNIQDDELNNRLNKILESIREPMYINQHLINISFSVGVAICPIHGITVKELMNIADNAMYKAKELGKNCIYYAK